MRSIARTFSPCGRRWLATTSGRLLASIGVFSVPSRLLQAGEGAGRLRDWFADKVSDNTAPWLNDPAKCIEKVIDHARFIGMKYDTQSGGIIAAMGARQPNKNNCTFCECFVCEANVWGGKLQDCICFSGGQTTRVSGSRLQGTGRSSSDGMCLGDPCQKGGGLWQTMRHATIYFCPRSTIPTQPAIKRRTETCSNSHFMS